MGKRTAAELDALADKLESDESPVGESVTLDRAEDLLAVAQAADDAAASEARLREAVDIARAHGRSWGRVGLALGVSRQAAQQRFGRLVSGSHEQ